MDANLTCGRLLYVLTWIRTPECLRNNPHAVRGISTLPYQYCVTLYNKLASYCYLGQYAIILTLLLLEELHFKYLRNVTYVNVKCNLRNLYK